MNFKKLIWEEHIQISAESIEKKYKIKWHTFKTKSNVNSIIYQ